MGWTTTVSVTTQQFLNLVVVTRFVNPVLKIDVSEQRQFADERQLANYILQTRLMLERFAAFRDDIGAQLAAKSNVYDADARLQEMQDAIDAANPPPAPPTDEEIVAAQAQQDYNQKLNALITAKRDLDIGLIAQDEFASIQKDAVAAKDTIAATTAAINVKKLG